MNFYLVQRQINTPRTIRNRYQDCFKWRVILIWAALVMNKSPSYAYTICNICKRIIWDFERYIIYEILLTTLIGRDSFRGTLHGGLKEIKKLTNFLQQCTWWTAWLWKLQYILVMKNKTWIVWQSNRHENHWWISKRRRLHTICSIAK